MANLTVVTFRNLTVVIASRGLHYCTARHRSRSRQPMVSLVQKTVTLWLSDRSCICKYLLYITAYRVLFDGAATAHSSPARWQHCLYCRAARKPKPPASSRHLLYGIALHHHQKRVLRFVLINKAWDKGLSKMNARWGFFVCTKLLVGVITAMPASFCSQRHWNCRRVCTLPALLAQSVCTLAMLLRCRSNLSYLFYYETVALAVRQCHEQIICYCASQFQTANHCHFDAIPLRSSSHWGVVHHQTTLIRRTRGGTIVPSSLHPMLQQALQNCHLLSWWGRDQTYFDVTVLQCVASARWDSAALCRCCVVGWYYLKTVLSDGAYLKVLTVKRVFVWKMYIVEAVQLMCFLYYNAVVYPRSTDTIMFALNDVNWFLSPSPVWDNCGQRRNHG